MGSKKDPEVIAVTELNTPEKKDKRGLVLAGGGDRYAFELGVLEGLAEKFPKLNYDFMSGTSAGALHVGTLGMYETLKPGVEHAIRVFESLKGSESIYNRHAPFGKLHGLWKNSFYDSSPLAELVHDQLDIDKIREVGRQLRFGCVDFASGKYFEADQSSANLAYYILGSSAFPGFLTPVSIDNKLIIDGGVRRVTPLKSAIQAGCTEIDVILTSPQRTPPASTDDNWLGTKFSAITILLRTLELLTKELYVRDLKMCELHNAHAAAGISDKAYIKLNIFEPDDPFPGQSLEFDVGNMTLMREAGREVARREWVS